MLFLDSNTWLIYRLNKEIKNTEKNVDYYKQEIEKDIILIKELDDKKSLEKYARKTYFMKKENEDIFIIEHQKDSLHENE